MQIDRYNHLLFPRDANTTGKDADPAPGAAGSGARALAKPHAGTPAPAAAAARAAGRLDSVVLNIQWPGGDVANNPDPGVYTNGRKAVAPAEADTATMARDHQLAVDRNAGNVTRLAVNKDGVLIAQPHPAPQDKQADFVALAVSAMREYSDEHDRQKVRTAAEAAPTPLAQPEVHWNALKGLQQIAAKLNVFA